MSKTPSKHLAAVNTAIDEAARTIPPMWPLEATVAVNPFLGSSVASLGATHARFASMTGQSLFMKEAWFQQKLDSGKIGDSDLAKAIKAYGAGPGLTPEKIRQRLRAKDATGEGRIPTVLDLAGEGSGVDLRAIMTDRVTAWASNYFDEGQALWQVNGRGTVWSSWRAFATNDLTPEVLGLSDFCQFASSLPDDAAHFVASMTQELGLKDAALPAYLTQLLFDLGGWSQLGRYRLWKAEMAGETSPVMTELLAIAVAWEVFAFRAHGEAIALDWKRACRERENSGKLPQHAQLLEILQYALDHAGQRELEATMAAPRDAGRVDQRPAIQAAFCIDVRSEVFRRALEGASSSVETLGFAGFFGLGVNHKAFASDTEEHRLPVLLNPSLNTVETVEDNAKADREKRFRLRAVRAWGRFKLAAVSSFAFVESAGPIYVPKLLQGALGLKSGKSTRSPVPRIAESMPLEARTDAAETILRAMSLTRNFARLVLLVGHGAAVTNNPHASALQCGACGGYAGDVNARLLAGLLNETAVRAELEKRGIVIPEDTHFVGGLHDTTSDQVSLHDDTPSAAHSKDIEAAKELLDLAGERARAERAPALPRVARPGKLKRRGKSWSQTRQEWGLAGCSAFIAAPRSRTAGKDLSGRSFLHSYDWRDDEGFKVLELILTAPVVVASWINLQYYGSTVAPEVFGAGNKLLHNVVGGFGVLEGNGGSLRSGLPLQSVSDGIDFRHIPVRLSVCIEAPREAITEILNRHESVRALFDNHWLHLFAMDDAGHLAWRYAGDGQWEQAFATSPAVHDEVAA
ncbi:YbcC family protein [Henriciella mobilis]|uniref:Probable inorganic carbon transporter subunit DabA n=1 Tax=Henriciella mobilis TaxID=2305467 RepID=A0A399R740_9PROT|nr:DUF2309 domain-containing protein [Henriciella mobilis]RIJ27178.1 DUF2309 domain-containing protein [Henriciella mobilis]